MEAVKISEIAEALGVPFQAEGTVTSLCTDSREAGPGSLFVAIPGERVDGHDYIAKALERGAACALAQRPVDAPEGKVLYVPDTVKAMLKLSAWYRQQFPIRVVGITGSVGKTTTKDMVAAALSSGLRVAKTQGNQNNEIGAPRTLLSVEKQTEALVIEMGMTGFGEIRELAEAARPDMGIITGIGVCHLEQLGSRENILKAKLELADCLPDGALLLLCGDNDLLSAVRIPRLHVVFYGIDSPDAEIRGVITESTPHRTSFEIHYAGRVWQAEVPGAGRHLVQNALAAFGAAVHYGLSPEKAVQALREYVPSGMRQKIVEKNGMTFVEDCYNASPDSMAAAFRAMGDFRVPGKKYAALSDMLELGSYTEEGHLLTGRRAAESGISGLFLYGNNAELYERGAREAGLTDIRILENQQALAKALAETMKPGDLCWFKASHSMRMEDALDCLYQLLENGKN